MSANKSIILAHLDLIITSACSNKLLLAHMNEWCKIAAIFYVALRLLLLKL